MPAMANRAALAQHSARRRCGVAWRRCAHRTAPEPSVPREQRHRAAGCLRFLEKLVPLDVESQLRRPGDVTQALPCCSVDLSPFGNEELHTRSSRSASSLLLTLPWSVSASALLPYCCLAWPRCRSVEPLTREDSAICAQQAYTALLCDALQSASARRD